MFQFNIAIYITILLSVIGCRCGSLNQDNLFDALSDSGNTKPVIALFHGLSSSASAFACLVGQLKSTFPDADVVALTSVENNATSLYGIKEQAATCFTELSQKIPDLRNRPILLIGHSQGGLRAYKMFDLHKDALNVKGIITLATPWEGAPLLNVDYESLSRSLETPSLVHEMETLSKGLNKDANCVKDFLKEKIQSVKSAYEFPMMAAGFLNLKPGNDFLDWVKNTLPSAKVPILAIGGKESDVNVFLHKKSSPDFQLLRDVWTQLVVGQTHHSKEHDMVVPLYSQLARNIAKGNPNFKTYIIEDAIHDELFDLPASKASRNILKHPEMFEEVKQCVRSAHWQKTRFF